MNPQIQSLPLEQLVGLAERAIREREQRRGYMQTFREKNPDYFATKMRIAYYQKKGIPCDENGVALVPVKRGRPRKSAIPTDQTFVEPVRSDA